jgi:hypothetical protein
MEWGRAMQDRPPSTMPADFHYAPLPDAASEKVVVLTMPIRIVCGSDEAVGNFVPDPNISQGSVNNSSSAVDVSAPNAAPEGVYKTERYAKDFAHTIPVAKGRPYHVRLHFAEEFDNGAGRRVENIAINGQPVLKDFDIFTAAGGMHKAVVKDFGGILPDTNGNIVVRISAAPGSPDQNAKISGIEILEETGG